MPGPLFIFFSQFPTFPYTRNSHPSDAFGSLVEQRHLWGLLYAGDKRRLKRAYQDALTQEFNELFGTKIDDLPVWQNLCRSIGLEVPPTVKECRQLIARTHVNLVDLVNAELNNGRVTIFPSVRELSDYTKLHGKVFPRHNIYAGDLLQYLLRHIANPSLDDGRGEDGSRGQGGRGRRLRRGRGQRGRGRAGVIPNE